LFAAFGLSKTNNIQGAGRGNGILTSHFGLFLQRYAAEIRPLDNTMIDMD